jgi:AcrR family transcriptional regulator
VTPPTLSPGSDSAERPSREERRRRTEATILEAARELFAELGYERATIRGVASRAGVDPALVMQYFGSKEGLFSASARWHVDQKRVSRASRGDLPHTVIEDLLRSGDDGGALALLRSCLTHEAAREIVREEVIRHSHAAVARTIGGPDAELRAGVLAGVVLGLTLGRNLMKVPGLADASPEDLERVLLPLLEGLVGPER